MTILLELTVLRSTKPWVIIKNPVSRKGVENAKDFFGLNQINRPFRPGIIHFPSLSLRASRLCENNKNYATSPVNFELIQSGSL